MEFSVGENWLDAFKLLSVAGAEMAGKNSGHKKTVQKSNCKTLAKLKHFNGYLELLG